MVGGTAFFQKLIKRSEGDGRPGQERRTVDATEAAVLASVSHTHRILELSRMT